MANLDTLAKEMRECVGHASDGAEACSLTSYVKSLAAQIQAASVTYSQAQQRRPVNNEAVVRASSRFSADAFAAGSCTAATD